MFKPKEVRALPDYRLWIRYADGREGVVDLSEFAGKGVFKLWDEAFDRVYIGEDGQIAWSDQIEMCPDALYLRLTNQSPEEVFPNLSEMQMEKAQNHEPLDRIEPLA